MEKTSIFITDECFRSQSIITKGVSKTSFIQICESMSYTSCSATRSPQFLTTLMKYIKKNQIRINFILFVWRLGMKNEVPEVPSVSSVPDHKIIQCLKEEIRGIKHHNALQEP